MFRSRNPGDLARSRSCSAKTVKKMLFVDLHPLSQPVNHAQIQLALL